jgi:hypothetical protein
MRTVPSPVSPVPCSLDSHLSIAVLLVRGGLVFRMRQPNHSRYCCPFWASCTWQEKGVGYGSFSVNLVTSCLVQACSSSSAPMRQKASPRPCRMAQDYVGQNKSVIDSSPLCVSRDSTGHENRAFLAAGVGCRHA